MIYAVAVLILIIFYLLLRMRSAWQQHEDEQNSRLLKLEEENQKLIQRVQHLEAIEAGLGPDENMQARNKGKASA